jgi:hypothetical protein
LTPRFLILHIHASPQPYVVCKSALLVFCSAFRCAT